MRKDFTVLDFRFFFLAAESSSKADFIGFTLNSCFFFFPQKDRREQAVRFRVAAMPHHLGGFGAEPVGPQAAGAARMLQTNLPAVRNVVRGGGGVPRCISLVSLSIVWTSPVDGYGKRQR